MKELKAELEAIRKSMYAIFGELFTVVENVLKMAITNNRRVVIRCKNRAVSHLMSASYRMELNAWIASGEAPTYTDSANRFGGDLAEDIFNEYCGMFVEQELDITDLKFDEAVIQLILEHTMRVVGNDKELYELLLDHLADSIQNPHCGAPRVRIIKGRQGCGKGAFIEVAFAPIYGADDPNAHGGHGDRGQ